MTVEHRLGTRHNVDLDVVIDYAHSGVLTAQAHNISVDGMFLRPDKIHIPLYARVNVVFELFGQQIHRRAFVVRRSPRGIGVMFDKRTPELLSLLKAVNSG
jgi:hypothetical protein